MLVYEDKVVAYIYVFLRGHFICKLGFASLFNPPATVKTDVNVDPVLRVLRRF